MGQEKPQFIRKNGRIIPIRERKGVGRRAAAPPPPKPKRQSSGSSEEKKLVFRSAGSVAAVTGTSGAAYEITKHISGEIKEKAAPNYRNIEKFKAQLQPGDILVMGSQAKYSGGVEFGDAVSALPKSWQKPAMKVGKKVGLKKNSVVLSNANLLSSIGGGKKYHAAIYAGKNRVIHMSTDAGAISEALEDTIAFQNVSILRPKVSKAEKEAAVKFAKKAVYKKVQYQGFSEYSMNAVANLFLPIRKKAVKCFDDAVCHTLPTRAYGGKVISNEWTMAGAFRNSDKLDVIARRDTVKTLGTSFRSIAASVAKGGKWVLPGAAIGGGGAYLYSKFKKRKKKS